MYFNRLAFVLVLSAGLLGGCGAGAAETPPAPTASQPTGLPAVTPQAGDTAVPTETTGPISFPATTAVLVWHREGGIAGYCDDLTVHADGSFTVSNCVIVPAKQRTGQLDVDQLSQLARWVDTFKSFAISDGQRAVSPDAMILKMAFTGVGTKPASADDRAAIGSLATQLVALPAPDTTGTDPQAVLKAREYLARELNMSADDIVVISFGFVAWPDRCLGVVVMGEMCAQGVTPGYKVILQAQAQLYELHTDESGESIRQVP